MWDCSQGLCMGMLSISAQNTFLFFGFSGLVIDFVFFPSLLFLAYSLKVLTVFDFVSQIFAFCTAPFMQLWLFLTWVELCRCILDYTAAQCFVCAGLRECVCVGGGMLETGARVNEYFDSTPACLFVLWIKNLEDKLGHFQLLDLCLCISLGLITTLQLLNF